MSCLLRRLYTTTAAANSSGTLPSAAETASAFLTHARAAPPLTRTQTLDANQLHLLSSTLSLSPPHSSAAIPPTHHLIYFTPSMPTSALRPDGTDAAYSPAPPFTRRMWAGGSLRWAGGPSAASATTKNLLRVGQRVTETTVVKGAEAKKTAARAGAGAGGGEMVLVSVEKVLENEEGWAVVDQRNWIFRPEITVPLELAPKPTVVPFPEGRYTRDLLMTPVTLFRFSALTFNGHKIHYDREWCREVEGHRDVVVHGPLNLIHMVDFWRDVLGHGDAEFVPKSVVYRATSPLYAGEPYRIVMDEEKEGVSDVRIVDAYGNVSMVGKIERFQ